MNKKERPHLQEDEARFFGKNACLAIWQHRPKDVIRVYIREDLRDEYAELLTACAKLKKSYHLVKEGDLERLASSVHHQGICLVARRRTKLYLSRFLQELKHAPAAATNTILFLDGVENPHNLGAILRTASFLGIKYILGEKGRFPRLSPAAVRTAEGAAETVTMVECEDAEYDFAQLRKQGYRIFATDVRPGSLSLFETKIPARCLVILGAEVTGVSQRLFSLSDQAIHIPGSGEMESLNVSVAAGILLAECVRQRTSTFSRRIVRNELKS